MPRSPKLPVFVVTDDDDNDDNSFAWVLTLSNIVYCSFWPIAVVSILAKVLEKIVSDQLCNYLENHCLLHPHQGAYRCGKSTEDILLIAVDSIIHSLDRGEAVCVAFLDLHKAFDSLDHCILLQWLYEMNLSPAVLWCLQNRKIAVASLARFNKRTSKLQMKKCNRTISLSISKKLGGTRAVQWK